MTRRHVHPVIFLILIMPFGVISGFLTVTLGWLLTKHGLSVEQIAVLVGASFIPHTWKFLWAPIADTTLTRKAWYLMGSVVTALGIFATGAIPPTPANLGLLTSVVIASNFAVTFLGMSVESLMAFTCDDVEKGRAGGWFQAGNLGGQGIGGGVGLFIAQHAAQPWLPGAVLGAGCFACSLALFFIAEPSHAHRAGHIGRDILAVVKDIWAVTRSKLGFLALALCFTPIGSGAASGLWSAVANDWKASPGVVALVTGVAGGLIMAAGCIVGGWICDRTDRKVAYLWFGVMQAACAALMGWLPHTQTNYVVFTSLYAFITGFTYAGFTAFVLEAMGLGAAATKFSLFASLSNFPIQWVTGIDGWAHTKYGPAGMLYAEALVGVGGLIVFTSLWTIANRFWRGAERAPALEG